MAVIRNLLAHMMTGVPQIRDNLTCRDDAYASVKEVSTYWELLKLSATVTAWHVLLCLILAWVKNNLIVIWEKLVCT